MKNDYQPSFVLMPPKSQTNHFCDHIWRQTLLALLSSFPAQKSDLPLLWSFLMKMITSPLLFFSCLKVRLTTFVIIHDKNDYQPSFLLLPPKSQTYHFCDQFSRQTLLAFFSSFPAQKSDLPLLWSILTANITSPLFFFSRPEVRLTTFVIIFDGNHYQPSFVFSRQKVRLTTFVIILDENDYQPSFVLMPPKSQTYHFCDQFWWNHS